MAFHSDSHWLSINTASSWLCVIVPLRGLLAKPYEASAQILGEHKRKEKSVKAKKLKKKGMRSRRLFTNAIVKILNRREGQLRQGRGIEIRDVTELKEKAECKAS
jgi:hypothetical protein